MRNKHKQINNTSGTNGVYYSERDNKWVAQINLNNKAKRMGSFDNIQDAIKARKDAEEEYYQGYAFNENN